MTTVRTKAVFALIAAFALVLAGCGGGDVGGSDDSAAATELEIRMDSFFFDPADTTVVADTDIDLSVLNLDASLQHNWVIINPGSEISDEADFDESDILYETSEVEPNASATGTFSVAAGEYQVICTIPGHFSAGMKGTLTAVAES